MKTAAELHKEATSSKASGDWPRAISCLYQAKDLMEYGVPIETWLRLPVFLQQAGRFDEAISEFQWLVERVQSRDKRLVTDGGPYFIRHQVVTCLIHIYDKMRLACQRQGRQDQAREYADTESRYQDLRELVEPLVEAERKKERAAYAAKKFGASK